MICFEAYSCNVEEWRALTAAVKTTVLDGDLSEMWKPLFLRVEGYTCHVETIALRKELYLPRGNKCSA